MHVLICNERFLFRFGVDRALLLIGRGLAARGHRVTVMGNRFDESVVRSFASRVVTLPVGGASYAALNAFTASWLANAWHEVFADGDQPDVAILGGWPFFASIPLLEERGCRTVFMDCGAVPTQGYTGAAREIQERVAEMRRRHLPSLSLVTPISDFIARTQSGPQATGVDVRPILLGADHMGLSLWDATLGAPAREPSSLPAGSVAPVIVSLGRYEPGCYKRSEDVFGFVDRLRRDIPAFTVAVLATREEIDVPATYREHVVPVGHPDDAALQLLMGEATLGVSFSTWEGFNLPLAEMQWLRRPVVALDVAAHPEVVVDRWFLAADAEGLADRAADVLRGGGPLPDRMAAAWRTFASRFRWERVVDEYEDALLALRAVGGRLPLELWMDVSNAARDDANSGVVRVTRRLAHELQRYVDAKFVIWDEPHGRYAWPTAPEYERLAAYNGPTIAVDAPRSPDASRTPAFGRLAGGPKARWLMLTETVLERHGGAIRRLAAESDIRTAAVFYDAIPVLRPDLVKDDIIRDNHAGYMEGLSQCDVVMPISKFSEHCLETFWRSRSLAGGYVHANVLPGEFASAPRATEPSPPPQRLSILCVSTLEPRKNHRIVIEAFERFARDRGDDVSLTLVGNRYAGGDAIVRYVTDACERDRRIRWLGVVDDAALQHAYAECTFTVYASQIEGFGMPILESLWHGKPCICHREGVMAEIAGGGGCLTVDVNDAAALAVAFGQLASDPTLYSGLVRQSLDRPIRTWRDYALQAIRTLDIQAAHAGDGRIADAAEAAASPTTVTELLYPRCLTTEWQMNESERLGMMAVLHRLQPTCAIEVGTYKGGSLSLLSQYAKAVFSIDIDPTIPERLRRFTNVSFLTGPSGEILPALLRELDAAGMSVEFVLIDGDHSTEGVRRDIEIMLDYAPKKPLVMMMHDGFNPDCRQGMLAARWSRSPYVQWVDLDFIPGRVVEHGGGGDGGMWGGLAMALLTPAHRRGPLSVDASSKRIFAELAGRHHAHHA